MSVKILVINGSPRGETSNTYKVTTAFLEGLRKGCDCDITVFHVYQSTNLHACKGCFNCWTKHPGKCIFSDDMPLQQYLEADIVVWSFPLYYFSMPSQAKLVMDRLLPTIQPTIRINEAKQCYHPSRYDISEKRILLISTCGFYQTTGNYDALLSQFERVYEDMFTPILCPQGELLGMSELGERTEEYLAYVSQAGAEYLREDGFSAETRSLLAEPLFSSEAFLEMANAHWDIAGADDGESKGLRLLKQMAALYNNKFYTDDITLEICFTDTGEIFQLCINKNKCIVKNSDFYDFTTRIETTLEVWQDIAKKRIDGAQALMDGLYSVSGRFETMHELDNLFNPSRNPGGVIKDAKVTNMMILLLPFIVFWTAVPFSVFWGCIGVLASCIFGLCFHLKYRLCVYDYLGIGLSTVLSVFGLYGADSRLLLVGSYVIFAVLWGGSCLFKIPLTAFYSINDYDSSLFHNPIFIITNRILTLAWSIAYLVGAGVIYFLYGADLGRISGILTSVIFAGMGLFTKWFKDFYPAYIASRKE